MCLVLYCQQDRDTAKPLSVCRHWEGEMTSKEREMFQVMIEKNQAIAQSPRFSEACRAVARETAQWLQDRLRLQTPA